PLHWPGRGEAHDITARWGGDSAMARTALTLIGAAVLGIASVGTAQTGAVLRTTFIPHPTFWVFFDPGGNVNCKEFAFVYNVVPDPDTSLGRGQMRSLFHLVYQRSGGLQAAETRFGHAWSSDLLAWSVDTAFFAVDTTGWN